MLKKTMLPLVVLAIFIQTSIGAPPVVKTVPWVASNPLIPHDTWSGKTITFKGTCDRAPGANIKFSWDFGDGSPITPFVAYADKYAIEATHAYSDPVGTVRTATLTVQDTATGESASKQYYVKTSARALPIEVNVAIDEGLWRLHKTQIRTATDGYWSVYGYVSETAVPLNAFEVNGHLEGGNADNPYTETVARGMKRVFTLMHSRAIVNQALGNPDANGNGIGLSTSDGDENYQNGIIMDAIIASGTPAAVTTTGDAVSVLGRTYKEVVQDMVDFYAFGQTEYSTPLLGGWYYTANVQQGDNSASQWAAIGLIPAEHLWSCVVPDFVKPANTNWLNASQQANGIFGYTSPSPIFGPFGTTPSGMVQLAMDGVGRGDARWDLAETYMRDHFTDATSEGNYTYNVKEFYYGEIAFTKAMLLHDSNGDGTPEPITMLHSQTPGVPDIDWYSAEGPNPELGLLDEHDGIARSLIKKQNADKSWTGHSWTGATDGLATGWAIIMLQRTLFAAGAPVAVAKANPNPAVGGQTIQLDGSDSFHQDVSKHIVQWDWDLDNNGTFETSGPFPTVSFPAVGNYPVKLRVTDDAPVPATADTTLTIVINLPPLAPTANAGSPYSFCAGMNWFLDATGSVNPDEGQSEPGKPGDTIVTYEWDLDGNGVYDDAVGSQPDVTAFFTAKGPGNYLIQLKVTDRTGTSFPSSGLGDLSDTDSTTVQVRAAGDPACACISDLAARPKSGEVQLTWTHTGAHHYNVYRSFVAGGPYSLIAVTTSTYSTYLDKPLVNGTTYRYVVRPANALDQEQCQSNEAAGTPVKPRGR